jgi:D-alanyl-D-alanine dipeptidase
LGLFAVEVLSAAFLFGQVKTPETAPTEVPFERSLQAVVVVTPNWESVQGKALLVERKNERSKWKPVGDKFPVVVGKNGLGLAVNVFAVVAELGGDPPGHKIIKKEGDGRAPAGLFPLTFTFGNSDVGSKLPFTKLDEFTECVDDVRSDFYNKIVNRMPVGNLDWKSSEKMLAVGPQYDLGVFVAYNSYPVIIGNGSCIFLHIWKDANTGTAGCTAMARENLKRIVKWLDPAKAPYLVQMTQAAYGSEREILKLPKLK